MGARTTGALLAAVLVLAAGCASLPEARVAAVDSLAPTRAVPAPDATTPPAEAPALREIDLEARVLALANVLRETVGAPVLTERADLVAVARGHARDMAERAYFSHTSPEGDGPGERAAHIRFRAFGEILARVRYAKDPGKLAIRGWLESPPHRRVLLDERGVDYRFTGVGAAIAKDGTIYIAQVYLK